MHNLLKILEGNLAFTLFVKKLKALVQLFLLSSKHHDVDVAQVLPHSDLQQYEKSTYETNFFLIHNCILPVSEEGQALHPNQTKTVAVLFVRHSVHRGLALEFLNKINVLLLRKAQFAANFSFNFVSCGLHL